MGLRNAISDVFVQSDDPNPTRATAPWKATAPAKPARVFSPFVAVFAAICAGRENTLASKSELAELRAAQKQWEAFDAQLASVASDSAKAQIDALRAAYNAEPSAENFAKLREAELNKDALRARFAEIRSTVKQARRESSTAIAPLAAKILEHALRMVEAALPEVIAEERKLAERYGVPHTPTAIYGALQNLHHDFSARIATANDGLPMSNARGILSGVLTL